MLPLALIAYGVGRPAQLDAAHTLDVAVCCPWNPNGEFVIEKGLAVITEVRLGKWFKLWSLAIGAIRERGAVLPVCLAVKLVSLLNLSIEPVVYICELVQYKVFEIVVGCCCAVVCTWPVLLLLLLCLLLLFVL